MRYFRLIIFVCFIILSGNNLKAQVASNCDSLLKREINYDKPQDIPVYISRYRDCFGLDSIDVKLFGNSPVLGTMLVQLASKGNGHLTFMALLNFFNLSKQDTGYVSLRKLVVTQTKLESTIASASTWDDSKALLIKVGISPEEIQGMHLFMIKNQDNLWNYRQLVINYNMQMRLTSQPSGFKTDNSQLAIKSENVKYAHFCDTTKLIVFAEREIAFNNYTDGLACSKMMKKPAFVIFNSYRSVNARKLENLIAESSQLSNYLRENYVIINLFIDDRTLIIHSKMTIGEINYKLEKEKFGTNYQPYEVIIDNDGKVLRSIGMPENNDYMLDFLKK